MPSAIIKSFICYLIVVVAFSLYLALDENNHQSVPADGSIKYRKMSDIETKAFLKRQKETQPVTCEVHFEGTLVAEPKNLTQKQCEYFSEKMKKNFEE